MSERLNILLYFKESIETVLRMNLSSDTKGELKAQLFHIDYEIDQLQNKNIIIT